MGGSHAADLSNIIGPNDARLRLPVPGPAGGPTGPVYTCIGSIALRVILTRLLAQA